MGVKVELKNGGHGSVVADGSAELLGELFAAAGLEGPMKVQIGQLVRGNHHQQGLANIGIKPGPGNNTIILTVQPGDNGTRREFRMDVPASERDQMINVLRGATTTEDAKPLEVGGGRSVATIKADIARVQVELAGFPSFDEQERTIAQREAGIRERQVKLDEERRKLDEERTALRQEIAHVQTRRRTKEDDLQYLELELEDATKKLAAEAKEQLAAVAAGMGLTVDEFLNLTSRKS